MTLEERVKNLEEVISLLENRLSKVIDVAMSVDVHLAGRIDRIEAQLKRGYGLLEK